MTCEEIHAALAHFDRCDETSEGSRIATHCMYPSFTPVHVYVAKVGDGYKVHDGAGAYETAWLHGRDHRLIVGAIEDECAHFHLSLSGKTMVADVPSIDWLSSAILSVANATALAAHAAVVKIVAVEEEALVDKIGAVLNDKFSSHQIARDFDVRGKSGGTRHFDFAILLRENDILINGVSPHRASIASKYVSFADTDAELEYKLAIHDQTLATNDVALLQQVASIVPLTSLSEGVGRLLVHGSN
jgi:hypothetical protein